MTIKVTKPSINLREKLNELGQDTGLKGQELMRADTVAEARTAIGAGRKNLIINGGFDVWQRGTSFSANGYNSDRWYWHQSGASGTMSQQAFSFGQTDVPGNPEYYCRLATTTGNNNNQLHQRLENVASLEAGTYTLSFWAKGTNPGGGICESFIWLDFGSGGSTGFYAGTSPSYTVAANWQKFTLTFTIPDLSSYTKGSNSYAMIGVFTQAGDTSTSAYTIDFANVQFEKDSVATDFEHRSYGEELALCQRYYEISGGSHPSTWTGDHYYDCINVQYAHNHTSIKGASFKVVKRGSPTVYIYDKFGVKNKWTRNNIETSVGSVNTGVAGFVRFGSGTAAGASVNNFYNFTADAEL